MKRLKGAICLATFLLAALAGCKQPVNNPLTEPIFRSTVEKQFSMAKRRIDSLNVAGLFTPPIDATPILFSQTESGNAGELYWKALKDRVDPKSETTQQFLNQTNPLAQVFDLAMKENQELTPSTIEVVKKEAETATALSGLADFEAGAKRKYSRIVGEVIPVPENILKQQLVPLQVLNGYMSALMAKAMRKESAGDKAGAETAMQTIVAVGQHISQDPAYLHYSTGQMVMKFGCMGLKSFYKRNNNADKEQIAQQLEKSINEQSTRLAQLAARDESGQNFNILRSLGYLDEGVEPLTLIAADENVPLAFRAGAIENLLLGYVFRYLMVERSGRPPETSDYPPPSDVRLKAFERLSTLSDKTLAEMATKSRQVLARMKDLNSGDRMKYWRELSAKS